MATKQIRTPADLVIHGVPSAFVAPLHVGRPNLCNRDDFLARVGSILDDQWLTNNGPVVQEFEERIASACVYKEELREIVERKQINVVRDMPKPWRTCVMRSKFEPMKKIATMARRHLEDIVAWAQPARPTAFSKPLTARFRPPNAALAAFQASTPSRLSFCLSPASSASPPPTLMPGHPLKIQERPNDNRSSGQRLQTVLRPNRPDRWAHLAPVPRLQGLAEKGG